MLTKALTWALERAESPRAVSRIVRLLEKSTGSSTADVVEWYQRNGYYNLAAGYGGYGASSAYRSYGGFSSYSGKTITIGTALESSALFAGTKIIAEDMGTLPHILHERSRDRKSVDEAVGHPLYSTLRNLWNPEISSGEGVEALTSHAILTGNGYALIERYGTNKDKLYLWPWQPEDVLTGRNSKGALIYKHRESDSNWKEYSRDQVFHLRGLTLDGVNGESILLRGRHTLGLTLAAEEYAGKYFSQGSILDVVIEFPAIGPGTPPQSPEAVKLIKEAWIKRQQGLSKAFEPAVLQYGAKVNNITPKAAETQLVEQRKFQILEVCRLLRLMPYKLADLDRAIQANIEQQSIEHVQHTLSPWVRRWRQAVYRCLLTVDERLADNLYAEHKVEALMRGDFAGQSEAFRKLLEKGVYSINEVRRLMNLNPVPGGEERFIQLNLGTVQEIAAGMNLPNAGGGEALRRVQ